MDPHFASSTISMASSRLPATSAPRGLEGFRALRELVHADDLAIAERVDVVQARVDLDPARPPARSEGDGHDHTVARLLELLGKHLVVVPLALPPHETGPDRIVPLGGRFLSRVPDDVGIRVPERLLDLEEQEPAHDLNVLLRHRALSIHVARRSEPLLLFAAALLAGSSWRGTASVGQRPGLPAARIALATAPTTDGDGVGTAGAASLCSQASAQRFCPQAGFSLWGCRG